MIDSQIIASLGVFILLLAFFLNLINALSTEGWVYPALNFSGASIAAYASWLIVFYPFVVLEGVWALVSLIALVNKGRKHLVIGSA